MPHAMIQTTSKFDASTKGPRKVDFLGIPLCQFSKADFVDFVVSRAKDPRPTTAYGINAHSVNMAFKSRRYWSALQQCDAVYCDGISVFWSCKAMRTPIPEKVTTTDCVNPISARFEQEGLSMYILGNAPGVAEQAAANLIRKYPRLEIKGTRSGYFCEQEEKEILDDIRETRPNLLWVGMGNPQQELWVERHLQDLRVPITLTCGGMMDIVSGFLSRPSLWVTDNGFEWVYRLINQPRHTWKRYLFGNATFLRRVAGHLVMNRTASV